MNEKLFERWAERLSEEVSDAVAVFLVGSYARGDAGPFSDVDFAVLVTKQPPDETSAWLDDIEGRLVYVSVWVRHVNAWIACRHEPQEWALGLASSEPMQLCWVKNKYWRARLETSAMTHPAAPPELDHFLGELGKVANVRDAATSWHCGSRRRISHGQFRH